jgi:hypothetical protein
MEGPNVALLVPFSAERCKHFCSDPDRCTQGPRLRRVHGLYRHILCLGVRRIPSAGADPAPQRTTSPPLPTTPHWLAVAFNFYGCTQNASPPRPGGLQTLFLLVGCHAPSHGGDAKAHRPALSSIRSRVMLLARLADSQLASRGDLVDHCSQVFGCASHRMLQPQAVLVGIHSTVRLC